MPGQIVIIGVGALGSHVALLGRNWKQGLKLVDFDRIESKNLQAQFHAKQGLTKNKALSAQQTHQGLFGTKVDAVPHRLTVDNAEVILGGACLVLDCTDNIEARRLIQATVKKLGIPCLHGAVTADGTFGRVIWTEDFEPDAEGTPGQPTCEDGEFLPFFCLVASQMAVAALRFLRKGVKESYEVMQTGTKRFS